jgi:hypothetical protein
MRITITSTTDTEKKQDGKEKYTTRTFKIFTLKGDQSEQDEIG